MKRYFYFLICAFVIGLISTRAQDKSIEITVDFDESSSVINPGYRNNASEIARLTEFLNTVKQNPDLVITGVELSGYTSLDGTHEGNLATAKVRAEALGNMISKNISVPSEVISYNPDYIPWEWLKDILRKSTLPYRDQAIAIINQPRELMDYYSGYTRDRRVYNLRWVGKSTVWDYLRKNYFPQMRRAKAKITASHRSSGKPTTLPMPPGSRPVMPVPTQGASQQNGNPTTLPLAPGEMLVMPVPNQDASQQNGNPTTLPLAPGEMLVMPVPTQDASQQDGNPTTLPLAPGEMLVMPVPTQDASQQNGNPTTLPLAPGEMLVTPVPTAQLREKFGMDYDYQPVKVIDQTTSTEPKQSVPEETEEEETVQTIQIQEETSQMILEDDNSVVVTPGTLVIKPGRIIIQSDNIYVENPTATATTQSQPEGTSAQTVTQQNSNLAYDSFMPRGHIKSNVANWALGQINFAFDFDFGPHWSFSFPVSYSGWNYTKYTIKFRTLDFKPEFRYWIKPLNKGLFIGAHAGFTLFNYAFNGEYRYTNQNRNVPTIGGGVSLGYRLPLGKSGHWNMELGLSGGVYYVQYSRYLNEPFGAFVDSADKTYVGLDGVNISFMYSFDLRKKR